ncbi:hypothetical protein LBMAG42_31350 [Deltaproteobacteria bacterium]|nr:hypothetical protein LBMAG42_31350 [Deltaproteobacteria bacterium]
MLFVVDERILAGHISDIHDDGFSIITTEDFSQMESRIIETLFLGALDEQRFIENLRIARVRHADVSDSWSLTVFIGDKARLGEFHQLLEAARGDRTQTVDPSVDRARLPRIEPAKHYTQEAVDTRLDWLRRTTGAELQNIDTHAFRIESLAGNVENFVGAVQVPLGIAGPIRVNGLYAKGPVAIPMATTEGALVASLNRGAVALNRCGGVTVHVRRQRMVRAPVFFCRDIHAAINLERWLLAHIPEIRTRATSVSSIAKLVDLQTFIFGRTCHVQFVYETGDASGQNMTTSCTAFACEWIREQVAGDPYMGVESFMIEGNMSGDKKVSFQNVLLGRGVGVVAEAWVSDEVLGEVLHVDAMSLARNFQASEFGAMQIGMMGHNANCANVIAGIFTATGQDIASVHESSLGILKLFPERGGIQLSLLLPSLVIGTVGGGTRLPTQRECLQIMGCAGQGQLYKFAEIIAAACLALDLSTLCAILSNEFVSAHEKLGRSRGSQRITRGELGVGFLRGVADRAQTGGLELRAATEVPLDSNAGIVNQLVSSRGGGVFGLFRYDVEVERGGARERMGAMLKLKSPHAEVGRLASGIVRLTGDDQLPGLFDQNFDVFGFARSDVRELEFYRHAPLAMRPWLPEVWGTRHDPAREVFAVLLEDLSACSHLNTVDHPEAWTDDNLRVVLRDLAKLAAATMERPEALWPGLIESKRPEDFERATPLFAALLEYQQRRAPDVFSGPWMRALEAFIANIRARMEALGAVTQCVSHNDFNTRNLALRPAATGGGLVVYDWELACVQPPLHDAMEFLIFALPPQSNAQALLGWLERYRAEHIALNRPMLAPGASESDWISLVHNTAVELTVNRMNLYWLLQNVKHFSFLRRVTANLRQIVEATHDAHP